jgi:FlaA1/EpsC-like NDP-sugar epimerase
MAIHRRDLIRYLQSSWGAYTHDLAIVPLAWLGAYWLRFNLEAIPAAYFREALTLLPVVWLAQAAMFWYFGLYRGIWRFASLQDLSRIFKAVTAGVAIAAIVSFILTRLEGVPRSVFIIHAGLLVLFLGGPRFFYRSIKDRTEYRRSGKRALIVGAGHAGEQLVRELLRDRSSSYHPVALIDDDVAKVGKEIHGVVVAGRSAELPRIAAEYTADLIVIAMPTAGPSVRRKIIEACEQTGLPFRTLPPLADLVSGRVSVRDIRDVEIDDLLGREPVQLDRGAITARHRGRPVLVSGGGGSIGSELCRQIARLEPSLLVVFEQSELHLYNIELELRREFPKLSLAVVLGDVGDPMLVEKTLSTYRPEVIFHAAAYKHVPLLEGQIRSAVRNNVLASRTLARAADKAGCPAFVLISTDKAVNPSSVMGATKHVSETYCQALNQSSSTRFTTVRFGNVLGSAGSVIPLFQKQIAAGGPVTVTDPTMTRFFMTIPEATQLILEASSVGEGGEIFVLDMGEPVNIKYLAEQLIILSGKKPGEDIEIVYTGLRPGEKLHEELFQQGEALIKTPHPKLLLARSCPLELSMIEREIDMMADACGTNDGLRLRELLDRFYTHSAVNGQTTSAAARQHGRQ